MHMNTNTMASPMAPAFKLVLMASSPSCAPTTLERSSSSSRLSPPIRMEEAIRSASSKLMLPSMTAWPLLISALTFGTLINSPS